MSCYMIFLDKQGREDTDKPGLPPYPHPPMSWDITAPVRMLWKTKPMMQAYVTGAATRAKSFKKTKPKGLKREYQQNEIV